MNLGFRMAFRLRVGHREPWGPGERTLVGVVRWAVSGEGIMGSEG